MAEQSGAGAIGIQMRGRLTPAVFVLCLLLVCCSAWLYMGIVVDFLICLRLARYMRIHVGLKAFYQVRKQLWQGLGRAVARAFWREIMGWRLCAAWACISPWKPLSYMHPLGCMICMPSRVAPNSEDMLLRTRQSLSGSPACLRLPPLVLNGAAGRALLQVFLIAAREFLDFAVFLFYILVLLGSAVFAFFQLTGGNYQFLRFPDGLSLMSRLTFGASPGSLLGLTLKHVLCVSALRAVVAAAPAHCGV